MKTREQDIESVKTLGHGGNCTVFWSEEGGGDVYRIWDALFLFSIPQYGGEGTFERAFHIDDAKDLVDLARTWT